MHFVMSAALCSGLVHALQRVPSDQLPETSLRASRPINVVAVLDGRFAFFVAALSATALSLVCFFMTLKDVFDTFWDDLAAMYVVRFAMISPLCGTSVVDSTDANGTVRRGR